VTTKVDQDIGDLHLFQSTFNAELVKQGETITTLQNLKAIQKLQFEEEIIDLVNKCQSIETQVDRLLQDPKRIWLSYTRVNGDRFEGEQYMVHQMEKGKRYMWMVLAMKASIEMQNPLG
jgi:hypothetical protein